MTDERQMIDKRRRDEDEEGERGMWKRRKTRRRKSQFMSSVSSAVTDMSYHLSW